MTKVSTARQRYWLQRRRSVSRISRRPASYNPVPARSACCAEKSSPDDWDPSNIGRLTVWEVTQHLIRRLDQKGEKETANLKAKIGGMAEIARDLAYRLYTLCERKGWAEEAGYYNSLVVAWPSMASEAFELN